MPLEVPIGLIVYYFSSHAWLACLIFGLSLNLWLEFRSNYLLTRKQVNDLLSDLLAPGSTYSFEELQVPPALLEGFWTYSAKDQIRSRTAKGRPYDKPVRVFRFQPSDEGKATNAAVAYPIESNSSLVFVRAEHDHLSEGQRLQLYHELAHGTTEGAATVTRGLRWKTLAALGFPLFCALSALCFLATHDWHRWLSLGLLIAASWFRRRGAKFIANWNSTDNECLADSIALAHPDFQTNDKWKTRAENLAKRLEDEAKLITRSDPKYFTVIVRADQLRKCLSSGSILLNQFAGDLIHWFYLAVPFYFLAGYCASLPIAFAKITFRTLLVLVLVSWLLILLNLLRQTLSLHELKTALDGQLKLKAQF
jgi:hypothetical protein